MTTPALLVVFRRLPVKPPPWAPDGSCIIMKTGPGVVGWTLGPKKRSPKGDPLLDAAKEHVVDLGKPKVVADIVTAWRETMPRGKGIAWTVWAWQVKTKTWVRP